MEMGGIAMPERVGRDSTMAPIELFQYGFDDILDAGFAHRSIGRGGELMIPSFGGKDPNGIAMRCPVVAESFEGRLWKRDHAIFGPFTAMDMNEHSFRVDVLDLKMESFLQS